jgi:hypothetical protein
MATDEIRNAAAALGRRGGQVKSDAKAAAVRANGQLGGPRYVAYDEATGWMSPPTSKAEAQRVAELRGSTTLAYRVRDGILVNRDGKPLPGPVQAR